MSDRMGRFSLRALVLVAAVVGACAEAARADEAALREWRSGVERLWLEGRFEGLDIASPRGAEGETLWPRLLFERWWRRPAADVAGTPLPDAARRGADPLLLERLEWLAAGGSGPYPRPPAGAADPWPVLTALVLDRQERLVPLGPPPPLPGAHLVALDPSTLDDSARVALVDGLEKLAVHDDLQLDAAGENERRLAEAALGAARLAAVAALVVLLVGCLVAAVVLRRPGASRPPTHNAP